MFFKIRLRNRTWFCIFRSFPMRFYWSGWITGTFHTVLLHRNQWPLSSPANWQWSSLFRAQNGSQVINKQPVAPIQPSYFKSFNWPICSAWYWCHTVARCEHAASLGAAKQHVLFFLQFPSLEFYIHTAAEQFGVFFWLWELALKYAEQTRLIGCLTGDKLLRENIVAGRAGLIKFPTL